MTETTASTDWERARRNLVPDDVLPLPGYAARAGAFAIDLALVIGFVVTVEFLIGLALLLLAAADLIPALHSGSYVQPAPEVFQWPPVVAARLAIDAVALAAMPWFWVRGGQTPAMAFLGLRVERVDGRPLDGRAAVIRMAGLVLAIISVVGIWWVFVDDRRRGLHDLLAGTIVIAE